MNDEKMKTMKLIKIIPVVLMGLFLTANAGASTIANEHNTTPAVTSTIENWMFDTNYLSGVAQTVEAWMFDECWLGEVNEESTIENWMLDFNYLNDEKANIESWMLDEGYLKGSADNVN